MSIAIGEMVGESSIVTNEKLAKEVGEKKEKNKLFEEALEEMKSKMEELTEGAKKKQEEEDKENGKLVVEEDVIHTPNPIYNKDKI